MDISQDVTISDCIFDINDYHYRKVKYWLHKTIDSKDSWVLTNFNFNITNMPLKTDDLSLARKRAEIVINTKISQIDSFISKLTRLTRRLQRNYIQVSPEFSKEVAFFETKLKKM